MTGDTRQAIEFLRRWEPAGPWTLTAIDPERGNGDERQRIQTRQFDPRQEAACAAWVDSWQGKRNIYFSANRVVRGITKKSKKEAVVAALCLHVDADPAPPPEGAEPAEHYAAEGARIEGLLRGHEPAPSVIIYSGGGYQGFWRLESPVPIEGPEDIEEIESRNRAIEHALTGGTVCWNIDRIMRLPGTINVPNEKKRKAGRVPTQAALVEADWDRVYAPSSFPAMGATKEPAAKAKAPAKKGGRPTREGGEPEPTHRTAHRPRRAVPEWCERLIAEGPDPEGKHSYGGDRSKAVFAVACALVRAGWSDEEIADTLADPENKISDHVRAQDGSPAAYAERQARKARAKVGTDFNMGDNGRPTGSQYNLRLALLKLGVQLTYDEFSRKTMIEGPGDRPYRYYDDAEETHLYLTIDEVFRFRPAREFFKDVMLNEGRLNSRHPVREYLDKLTWDGVERIDTWLTEYAGAEDSPYMRAVGRLMLLAAVRRVRQPGAKFDETLVFESKQGLDKSSALRALAVREEWFTDSLSLNGDDKAVIEAISGKWIVETAELKGLRGAAIEHVKALLSRQVDRARMAYGRHVTEAPRQCVFFSSTNNRQYLRDDENRRFWPCYITRFNVAALKRDRDQLWAEAAHREAQGESIRLDPELYEAADAEQRKRAIDEPWVNDIEMVMGDIETGKILSVDVWKIVNVPIERRTQEQNSRIGVVMQSLGWERVKLNYRGKKHWHYAKGTAEERTVRVIVDRDDDTGKVSLRTWRDGEEHPDYDGEPDSRPAMPRGGPEPQDIPF